ncbi:MAG: coproporphyrinogen dehydrogenase HemZ [Bacillota bacterium]
MMRFFTAQGEYANDLAEVLRIFLDREDVQECPSFEEPRPGEMGFCASLSREGGEIVAEAILRTHPETGPAEDRTVYRCPIPRGGALEQKRYEKRALKIAAFRLMKAHFLAYTPWGSLTGIRPTRLYRELCDALGPNEADRMMLGEFDVSPDKLDLAKTIVAVQRGIVDSVQPEDVGVYIGIPFCASRCLYCSFGGKVRGKQAEVDAYLEALKKDIALGADIVKRNGYRVRSLYVGGGTPTTLTAQEMADLLRFALEAYGGFGFEFTVEAGRPDTIDKEKLSVLQSFGVTRISINPQTMNRSTLERIGRKHTERDIEAAFSLARDLGFGWINMDLIAGLPGEGPEDMERTLEAVRALAPENLTVHTLAMKRSSRLAERIREYPLPDAETADAMVRMAMRTAFEMNMRPYYMYRQKYMRGNLENVGYALPGKECVYNVDMMEELTNIMAHGAGAMTKRIFGGEHRVERVPNPKDLPSYCGKIELLSEHKRRLFEAGH